jgi:hypothetical protein
MYSGYILPFHASSRKLWALRYIKSASQLSKHSSLLMLNPPASCVIAVIILKNELHESYKDIFNLSMGRSALFQTVWKTFCGKNPSIIFLT